MDQSGPRSLITLFVCVVTFKFVVLHFLYLNLTVFSLIVVCSIDGS